jgi:hypothetical protein
MNFVALLFQNVAKESRLASRDRSAGERHAALNPGYTYDLFGLLIFIHYFLP